VTVFGTPVDEHLNPTVHELYQSIDKLLNYMYPFELLILRSTCLLVSRSWFMTT